MSFPVSDHCNGKTFFYPGEPMEHGVLDVLRWKLTSRPAPWPRHVELRPSAPPPEPRGDDVVVTWINHSTFLWQTTRGNFLTDPVFSERTSPVSWFGPRRVHVPGVAFEKLPPIDVVLLSHDHYDHCDFPTLRRLAQTHQPTVIAPLGHRELLGQAGIKRIVELDWWQSHSVSPNAEITLTPAKHWCRRKIGETNHRLWGGFFARLGGRKIYFAGDSGYDARMFAEIRDRSGAPDAALIPIGAYEPRWFMRSAHMNPAEAIAAHRALESKRSFAMHWGCWRLTDEARDAPLRALEIARVEAGVDAAAFRAIEPGESVAI